MKEEYRWPNGLSFTRWFCDRCHMKYDDHLGSGKGMHETDKCAKCGKEVCKSCRHWFSNGYEISDGCGGSYGYDGIYLCLDCISDPDFDLKTFLHNYLEYEWLTETRKFELKDKMWDWCKAHGHTLKR